MAELILKFEDISGEPTSVVVDKERFIIGRHSECDLCVVDSRLSREHLLIEIDGDGYQATDRGSSNGTELIGEPIFETTKLKDGDELDLGGFKIKVEVRVAESAKIAEVPPTESDTQLTPPTAALPAVQDAGIPKGLLIAAALMAGGILLVLGVLVFISLNDKPPIQSGNFITSGDPDDDPTPVKRRTPEPTVVVVDPPVNGVDPPVNGVNPPVNSSVDTLPSPTNLTENAKVELNAAKFLRNIAQNNPKAFVTGEQAAIISSKIKSVSGSSALMDNISSARKNAAAIKTLAVSKNLKPQFLAVAAIASLGSSRGDVLQTAQKWPTRSTNSARRSATNWATTVC